MLETNNQNIYFPAFVNPDVENEQIVNRNHLAKTRLDILQPLRGWLDSLDIQNQKFARFIAQTIPAQCPFERDIVLFGRKIAHIPPVQTQSAL